MTEHSVKPQSSIIHCIVCEQYVFQGNNALESLQSWRARCESLSDQDAEQYQRLIHILSNKAAGGYRIILLALQL